MVNGYYGIETLYQTVKKKLGFFSSYECLLSKATGNSDSQNAILETTDNTGTQEIEVRK